MIYLHNKSKRELGKCDEFYSNACAQYFVISACAFTEWVLFVVLVFIKSQMAGRKISLLAQFDEICRGFSFWINDPLRGETLFFFCLFLYKSGIYCKLWYIFLEFEVFASNQEDCRKKWLTTEEMCSSALQQLNEARANREKLELQVRHGVYIFICMICLCFFYWMFIVYHVLCFVMLLFLLYLRKMSFVLYRPVGIGVLSAFFKEQFIRVFLKFFFKNT